MPNIYKALDELEREIISESKERAKSPLGMSLDEFKAAYIPQFLASWAANNYERMCSLGTPERLAKPPFEDAEHLAEETYENFYKYKNR